MNTASRFAKILAVISIILCFALLFCACDTTTDDDKNNGDTKNPTEDNTTGNDETPDDNTSGSETPDDGKVTYTVNVKDHDGNPIAGVEVQFCVGEICNAPVHSDANGVASVSLDPDNYHVKINPGVYAADPAEYEFEEGSTTLNVTVYKLHDGSIDDPIPVVDDVTQVKLKTGAKLYYTVSMPADKTLTLTIKDVNGRGAVIEYNGETYNSENGKVEVVLEGDSAINIAIYAADGKLAIFSLEVS